MGFETLGIGASGLFAAQRAAEVSAQNVANASNPAYTRERVSLTAAPPVPGSPGMRGSGVQVVSIDRLRDTLADVSYREQAAASGAADARAGLLSRAQGVLGPTGASVSDNLDAFWSSWSDLSLNPGDSAARTAVLSAGQQLTDSLNGAAGSLAQIGADAVRQAQDAVAQVNGLTAQVAALNKQVTEAKATGQNPNDLLDQRDQALDQLAQLTGARIQQSTSNADQVDVVLGGIALVSGTVATTLSAGTVGGQLGFAVGGSLGTGRPVALGGTLGGLQRVVNVDLPGFSAHLDALAQGLADTVNRLHEQGYAAPLPVTDPATGTTTTTAPPGGAFFAAAGGGTSVTAASIRVAVTSAADVAASATQAGSPNDGDNALALADAGKVSAYLSDPTSGLTPTLPPAGQAAPDGGPTVTDAVLGLVGRLGQAAAAAASAQTSAGTARDTAQKLRTDADGVSPDEEMVDLAKYQHAYEAAARVITVADSMLNTLINGMGAGR